MAPREPSIEDRPEYTDFIDKLKAYHLKRGTNFDPEPKAGGRHTDLLKLYKIVTEEFGGYDELCRVKKGWPSLATDRFNLGHPDKNPGAGFQLKTCYYKFLAAYEIEIFFKEVPPLRDILEDQTAGGGDLRTRTSENYKKGRDGTPRAGSSGASNEGTPSRDRMGSEETPGSGGRPSRLRERPPQRAMFSDTQAAQQTGRQTRNVSTPQGGYQVNQGQHGQRGYNPTPYSADHNQAVVNYEPRQSQPLSLRPVLTPGNAPIEWAKKEKLRSLKENQATSGSTASINKGIMLPGTGFDGPNIYVRCLCALKSGIGSEQNYALHHLVKISMERGDKYKFEGFAGLAEALIGKMLEVSSLFYNVDWQTTYLDDVAMNDFDALDGIYGTPDILEKIKTLTPIPVDDNIQDSDFQDAMLQVNEAALVLRNMIVMEDNAYYVSEMAPLRDFLVIALNLPSLDTLVELKHYALEIAESLTKYMEFNEKDPLYISLLAQLQHRNSDRGTVVTALGAINRISMLHEDKNLLSGIPLDVVQKISDWLLLGHDEHLIGVCLDFLNQYTALVPNVDILLRFIQLDSLVSQLVRLLRHGAKITSTDAALPGSHETREADLRRLAPLPEEVAEELRKLQEPERVVVWLRCLFEEDERESITQIELWQAYQACFTPMLAKFGTQMLSAQEFIKHVSSSFGATAQIDQSTPAPRFIIKGVRYRRVPVDRHFEPFRRCLWRTQHGIPCGHFFSSPQAMYNHVLKTHLRATTSEEFPDKFANQSGPYSCGWNHCSRFTDKPATNLAEFARHLKVHLPPSTSSDDTDRKKLSYIKPAPTQPITWHLTQAEERRDTNNRRTYEAAGILSAAADVLRNLARNIRKTPTAEAALKAKGISLTDQFFKPVEPQLHEYMALNKLLASPLFEVLNLIKQS